MLPLIQTGGGASGTLPSTIAKVSSKWLDSYSSVTGLFTQTQPDFTDLSGTASTAQIPNLSAAKITSGLLGLAQGGTNADLSGTGGASRVLKQVSIGAAITVAQLAFSDISGTVGASQLPNPSASTLGGIESFAAVSHSWINAISTAGVPAATQPAFTDISGNLAASQTPSIVISGKIAFWGDFITVPGTVINNAGNIQSNNQIRCRSFVLPFKTTVSGMAIDVGTTAQAGTVIDVAIYDTTGAGLFNSNGSGFGGAGFDGTSAGVKTKTFVAVTLNPGTYLLAWTGKTTGTLASVSYFVGYGNLNTQTTIANALATWAFVSSDAATAGILPSSLTIGNLSAGSGFDPPLTVFKA